MIDRGRSRPSIRLVVVGASHPSLPAATAALHPAPAWLVCDNDEVRFRLAESSDTIAFAFAFA